MLGGRDVAAVLDLVVDNHVLAENVAADQLPGCLHRWRPAPDELTLQLAEIGFQVPLFRPHAECPNLLHGTIPPAGHLDVEALVLARITIKQNNEPRIHRN